MDNLLEGLNEQQKKAVVHMEGPCLVIAGAGSGKTKVLTTRIAYLISQGIRSSNILAITFTNKAAKEMKERLAKLVPDNYAFLGTFHSLGVRILRENYMYLNLERNFTILDSDDVLGIIKKILKDKGIDPKECAPSYIRNRISFIKNENLADYEIDKFFNTPPEKIAKEVYLQYQEVLKKNNSVDFDDLLRLPVKLFKENKEVLEHYQEKFKYILVDEYQDTNEVQYQFNKLLASKYHNLFVVGDANQSIYGFRNANFQNILNFEKDYKDAYIVTLDQNYRSTNNILKTANSVIKNNKERKDLELYGTIGEGVKTKYLRGYDGKHEITLVISEIKNLVSMGYHYKDIGILYRTNGQARLAEEMMLKSGIPYKVIGSYYFYQRKEIKDLLCYLKLISNPNDDVALRRVINVPKRGIGQTSIQKIEDSAVRLNTGMFDCLETPKELAFKQLIIDLRKEAESLSLTELIDTVLDKSGMKRELEEDKSLENELRLDNLEEFKSITATFEERTGSVNLEDFLEEVSLVADMEEHKENDNGVTLMTIHSAKGLEFEVVFLIGMEEGIFPHQNSLYDPKEIEEERRLCYVGITRAKQRLILTNAKRRILYGKEQVNPPSRFIDEIDRDLLDIPNDRMFEPEKIKIESMYRDASDMEGFKAGDVIMHTIYGRGVVVGVDDTFVTVAFQKRYGIKKLMKNHKSIRKVG